MLGYLEGRFLDRYLQHSIWASLLRPYWPFGLRSWPNSERDANLQSDGVAGCALEPRQTIRTVFPVEAVFFMSGSKWLVKITWPRWLTYERFFSLVHDRDKK
jgi:hypothetical protein